MMKNIQENTSRKGTKVSFVPDEELFGKYRFLNEYIEKNDLELLLPKPRINNNLQW